MFNHIEPAGRHPLLRSPPSPLGADSRLQRTSIFGHEAKGRKGSSIDVRTDVYGNDTAIYSGSFHAAGTQQSVWPELWLDEHLSVTEDWLSLDCRRVRW